MIRYIPILMVAFGLLLLSTSFAAANSPVVSTGVADEMCFVISAGVSEPDQASKCWKQLGAGLLIPGCKAYAELPSDRVSSLTDAGVSWPSLANVAPREDRIPPLDLPPPRA